MYELYRMATEDRFAPVTFLQLVSFIALYADCAERIEASYAE
jgi:hypothetical protein